MKTKKRFQECSWPRRQLRRLWYLMMPYYLIRYRPRTPVEPDPEGFELLGWSFTWRLAKSMCQCRMNWYYTMDEVMDHARGRLKSKRDQEIH